MSLEQLESLPLAAQKTYIDIRHFIYRGTQNAILAGKAETDIQKRRELDAIRAMDIFRWEKETLGFLDSNGFITYSNGKIKLDNLNNFEAMDDVLKKYSKTHLDIFRHNVTDDPLALVDKLLEGIHIGSAISPKRSVKILRPHDAESTDSWAFCVPRCFNDALDIRLSENKFNTVPYAIWTQGSNFAFQRDDIIYDKPHEGETWLESLQNMKYCIHVEGATPAMTPEKESFEVVGVKPKKHDTRSKIIKVNPGHVKFKISTPNSNKTGLECKETRSVTQAEFVKILIDGI
jgi:hypothetical protein